MVSIPGMPTTDRRPKTIPPPVRGRVVCEPSEAERSGVQVAERRLRRHSASAAPSFRRDQPRADGRAAARNLRLICGLVLTALLGSACGSTLQQQAAANGSADALAGGNGLTEGGLTSEQATGGPGPAAALGSGQPRGRAGQLSTPAGPGEPAVALGSSPDMPAASAPRTVDQGEGDTAMPSTGPGWDREFVKVGVVTNQDVSTYAGTLGINSLDSGDQKAAAESMIAELNAQGGLVGRKIKPIFYDIATGENREASAQATCAYFTEDNQVVAVLNGAGINDTPSFRACMTKARTLVLSTALQVMDDQSLDREQGWYVAITAASWTRYATLLVSRLQAMSFFEGWDTTLGAPGQQPVKVGILSTDSPEHRRNVAHLEMALRSANYPPNQTFFYKDTASLQAAALRFKSDGITHVFNTDSILFSFMQTAESQGYRPRYAVNTLNLPTLLLAAHAPAAQLAGAVGVGWAPGLDVDHRHEPNPQLIPGARTCADIAKRRGPRYPPDKRFAITYFNIYCDMFRLIQAASASSGSLAGDRLRLALRDTARTVSPGSTFANGLSPRSAALPSAGLDLKWATACRCFEYSGGLRS